MISKYITNYILDLKHLEDIIYSKDYYDVGAHPYDSMNILIDVHTTESTKYILIVSISTETVKEIKAFSRSLSLNDLFITFIDSPDMVRKCIQILSHNIRTFPFKNIYLRASSIKGKQDKEFICSKHIVIMSDITGKYERERIVINIHGYSYLYILKLKFKSYIKRRKRIKAETINSLYVPQMD